jgi:hypothetical protein
MWSNVTATNNRLFFDLPEMPFVLTEHERMQETLEPFSANEMDRRHRRYE